MNIGPCEPYIVEFLGWTDFSAGCSWSRFLAGIVLLLLTPYFYTCVGSEPGPVWISSSSLYNRGSLNDLRGSFLAFRQTLFLFLKLCYNWESKIVTCIYLLKCCIFINCFYTWQPDFELLFRMNKFSAFVLLLFYIFGFH